MSKTKACLRANHENVVFLGVFNRGLKLKKKSKKTKTNTTSNIDFETLTVMDGPLFNLSFNTFFYFACKQYSWLFFKLKAENRLKNIKGKKSKSYIPITLLIPLTSWFMGAFDISVTFQIYNSVSSLECETSFFFLKEIQCKARIPFL